MKRFLFDCGTRDVGASVALLFLRVCLGSMMFFGHGLVKFQNFHALLDKGWPIPKIWPLSHMTMWMSLASTVAAEAGAAALIILGIATRPAAFVLGFAMVVAAYQVMANAPLLTPASGGPSKEMAVLYLVGCVTLIIGGGGLFSFDNPISKEKRRRR